MNTTLLLKVAGRIKSGAELWDSTWQNCEAEVIAAQTLRACAKNFREHGEVLSWQGKGTLTGRMMCGTNNAHGLDLLLRDGMIVSEEYTGTLKPDEPERIATRNGKYLVLRCTEKLLNYADKLTSRETLKRQVA